MTTVTLYLRDGDRTPEEVDLDALTPKARALAEAVAAQTFHNCVKIWVRNIVTGENRPWRGWMAHYPAESKITPAGFLEMEARKFPPDWQVPVQDSSRRPQEWEVRHTDDLMNRDEALARLRAQGAAVPIDNLFRGDMPRPIRHVATGTASMPLWSAAEIDQWATTNRKET